MATHSSILAWRISWRSLAGYSPWGRKSQAWLSDSTITCRYEHLSNRVHDTKREPQCPPWTLGSGDVSVEAVWGNSGLSAQLCWKPKIPENKVDVKMKTPQVLGTGSGWSSAHVITISQASNPGRPHSCNSLTLHGRDCGPTATASPPGPSWASLSSAPP